MGVEYRHIVMPRDRRYLPDDATVRRLVEALVAERWLPAGGGPRWDVEDDRALGLRYPFVGDLAAYEQRYYTLALVRSDDFIYYNSECIDPFDDVVCGCGAELEYEADDDGETFYFAKLRHRCEACGAELDPRGWTALVRDGMTGVERELPGGATFRFAIAIDCGKSVPSRGGSFRLAPELVVALSRVLGCELDNVGDYY